MLVKHRLKQDIYYLTRKKDIEGLERIGKEVKEALDFLGVNKKEEVVNERSKTSKSS